MTTPRIGNPISASQINVELGRSATAPLSWSDPELLLLSGEAVTPQPAMSRWRSAMKVLITPLGLPGGKAGYSSGFGGGASQTNIYGSTLIGFIGNDFFAGGFEFMTPPFTLQFDSSSFPAPYAIKDAAGNRWTPTDSQPNPNAFNFNALPSAQYPIGVGAAQYWFYLKFAN